MGITLSKVRVKLGDNINRHYLKGRAEGMGITLEVLGTSYVMSDESGRLLIADIRRRPPVMKNYGQRKKKAATSP